MDDIGTVLRWLGTMIAISGAWLNASKRPLLGHWLYLGSNVLMLGTSVLIRDWATVVLFAMFLGITIWGIRNWGRA